MNHKLTAFLGMFLLVMSGQAMSGTVSFDQLSVSSDLNAVKYSDDLNRIYQKVNHDIQTDNIENDTIAEVDMADNANARIRTNEGAWCADFVYTGLLPTTTTGTLVGSIPAGIGYPDGYRVVKSGATAKTFTATKWTWVYLDTSGNFQYIETAIGAATPTAPDNSLTIARVVTNGTEVTSVVDLRTTSCTTGPFNIIADDTGESTLEDLVKYGVGGIKNGLGIVFEDTDSVLVNPGSAYINGQYRTLTTQLSVPFTADDPSAGTSGLDTGSVAASTTYYLYAAADVEGSKAVTGIFSANATTPSGVTNYRKIGEASTNAASQFEAVSADITSISYEGKIRQIKRFQTGATATGSVVMVNDDTAPLFTEGDPYMSLKFTPTSSTNRLRIDVVLLGSGSAATTFASLHQNGGGALATCKMAGSAGDGNIMVFSHNMTAGSTAQMTFVVRAGVAAGTFTFNGAGGARLFGGTYASSITITEYEA